MTDKIIIKDLLLRGIVGINDEERKKRQDILINIEIQQSLSKPAKTDNIVDALNYKTLTKEIIKYVETSSHFLVESLAEELARIAIKNHGAEMIILRLEKPGALRFAESVGVEVTRSKEDFK